MLAKNAAGIAYFGSSFPVMCRNAHELNCKFHKKNAKKSD